MTWIHIIAGLLAICSGAIAMIAGKGSPLHRKSGTVFTISMLIMTGSAAIVSLFLRIDHVTGVAALFTAYLVVTSWLAVKRSVQQSYALLVGIALAAVVLGFYALSLWFNFLADPHSLITKNSPPQTLLVFGSISHNLRRVRLATHLRRADCRRAADCSSLVADVFCHAHRHRLIFHWPNASLPSDCAKSDITGSANLGYSGAAGVSNNPVLVSANLIETQASKNNLAIR
ncbi:MAG: hypothetical protein U5L01_13265 [Rheinheimera sp.]|nr:hypothetical protein [Rheinheimera sp.]